VKHTNQTLPLLLIVLVPSLGACKSDTLYVSNRSQLEGAVAAMNDGDYPRALSYSEKLIVDTNEDPQPYVLQRYYAKYLSTQIHMAAAVDGAFLEDATAGGNGITLGVAEAGLGVLDREEAPVGHLMATMYHSGHGLEWYPSVENAQTEADGEELLPASLEELGVKNAQINMALCQLAAYARLQFQERIDLTLRQSGMSALLEVSSCTEVLERSNFNKAVYPLIYYSIYGFLQEQNPIVAYRFGVRAIETAPDAPSAFGRSKIEAFEEWVTEHPEYEWYCSNDDKTSPPTEPRCIHCNQTPTIDFQVRRKAQ